MPIKLSKPLLLLLFLSINTLLIGQNPGSDSASNSAPEIASENFPPEPSETTQTFALPLSRLEFQLSIFVLAFGFLLILLEIYLIRNKNISSEDTIKFIVITIIIVSTLFLITAGYSNDQIAPAVGLLGTIAGYLLGRISSNKKEDEKT